MEDFKICTKCNLKQSIKYFEFRSDTNKYRNYCKKCNKGYTSDRLDTQKFIKELFEKGVKQCGRCKDVKTLDSFNNDKQSKTGKTSLCKVCISNKYTKEEQRNLGYKSRYNITIDDYNQMYSNQNGCCDICKLPSSKLVVDHCHINKNVRGLLCGNCNTALGMFGDNIKSITNAIKYLNKTKNL